MNSSRHPMAITGSQARALNINADKPAHKFLLMGYFNIGILMPCRFAASMAIS